MVIKRRQFLREGVTALAAAGLFPGALQWVTAKQGMRLLSCRSNADGQHFVSLFNAQGKVLFDIRLPTRGHGVSVNESHTVVAVFARRPGEFVWLIDLESGDVRHKISAVDGRYFYGHGVFTPDDRYLLCSENAFESGEGCIGVYDVAQGYQRVSEFASHGIGPHEIKLLSNQKTLVVANGGIQTHPDLPRVKSNLHNMQPSLAYVDIASGSLINKVEPRSEWHQLSIRHIDIAADDTVAIAMQFEGQRLEQGPALVATHHANKPLQLHVAPDVIQRSMRNYCGSVAFNGDGSQFAVSSPRGGLVTYWSALGGYLGMHEQRDVCGVARSNKGFVVSDGVGQVAQVEQGFKVGALALFENTQWDNHLVRV